MCLKCVLIKNALKAGIQRCYVPCGKCVDCRRKLSEAWSFRLNAEFLHLKKKGWNVAFMTLTYRPEDLPTIPDICFVNADEVRTIPCFNRSQVRKWIDDVRQYCKYHFGFKDENRMRYFIATELGTLRHRPHMHCVLSWPSSVSYEKMHKIVSDFWHYGYLFPRHYLGDGKCKSFEVVGDASKCLTYVSKYVCKDLELEKLIGKTDFYSERKKYEENSFEMFANNAWRNCQSFHIQSQSLGFEAVKNMTDEQKMSVYRNGLLFSADGEPQQVPIYIKRKLLFDPYYTYDDDGNRLVSKRANEFFLKHAHEIFDMKAEFYQKYCLQSETEQYYLDRGCTPEDAKKWSRVISEFRRKVDDYYLDLSTDNKMGKLYLAYNNVLHQYRYDIDLCNQWLLRYYPDANLQGRLCGPESFDYSMYVLDDYWRAIDYANSLLGSFKMPEREDILKRVNKCLDFFKNIA